MNRAIRDFRTSANTFESLEERRLLTVFGNAWPDARDLTVSFPADGTPIGSQPSSLHSLLDSVATRQQWQELTLRAYQSWAYHADINIGLRNDYNEAFGVPGMAVGDPRFGEFRIGALPQQGLVASSVPYQVIAGTYSGDLILNSNQQFTFHDWSNSVGPDPSTIAENDRDLFSLLLHESGNTLGLDDNQHAWSVMFRQYTVPKGVLTSEDINAIQALYGQRSDPFESVDNGQIQVATLIPTPAGFQPASQVIRSRGSLLDSDDVDVYRIVPIAGHDEVTIRVRTQGVSLLTSKLEVLDAAGQVISQSGSLSVFQSDNEITVSGIDGASELFIRVAADDPTDLYSVGDYYLEVDYRDAATRAADLQRGDYDQGPDELFVNFDLSDPELGNNDSILIAEDLSSATVSNGRFEHQSSVSAASDVDYLKIQAPAVISGRLIAHVKGVGLNRPDLDLTVVDSTDQSVGTSARLRPDGTFSVEVLQPQAGHEYFLRISVDPNSTSSAGEYVAIAEFETPSDQLHQLVSGQVTSAIDTFIRWTADKTRLFQFGLDASSPQPGQAVRLTIYDAHTLEAKAAMVTQGGTMRGMFAWLQQGDYILRFTALSMGSQATGTVNYSLFVDGLSDDQDEDESDPADDPNHDPYYYAYASGEGEYDDDPASSYYYYYGGDP